MLQADNGAIVRRLAASTKLTPESVQPFPRNKIWTRHPILRDGTDDHLDDIKREFWRMDNRDNVAGNDKVHMQQ